MSLEARTTLAAGGPIWRLLLSFSWQEWRRHGARHWAAMLAVALGVMVIKESSPAIQQGVG